MSSAAGVIRDELNTTPGYRQSQQRRRSGVEFDGPAYWFVSAYYAGGDPEDQLPRFLEGGIWENGFADKYLDEVTSMQPGERIAIKAAYTRHNEGCSPMTERGGLHADWIGLPGGNHT